MALDLTRTRQHLAACDFRRLFIEELGWDTHSATIEIPIDGQPFTLTAVAQKRGMVAFHCRATGQHGIPDYPTRRKIDRQLTKSVQEHLIIYTDSSNSTQVWQWVKREVGKPTACREHTYHRTQPGDALIQKLQVIAFTLDEEERLSLVDVTSRTRAAFDVERVTKRFYDIFQKEHAAFLKFLKGIPDDDLQRWYVSVMLNRLMFVYFIQKKGFLDGNPDYLRSKLAESRARGRDRFYREFLCPLFFEGFAKKDADRSAATNRLLGKVPYLNGGLFLRHQIEEQHGKHIQIADAAFEQLFAFFEQYQWHLDERPLRADNEINPDVLGYIFEKYINQKQMGAYYTKEDITGYISQNTVIPFLFDAARQKCKIAFEGNQSVWRLLQLDPDRYIYEPVKRGVIDEKGKVIPESALPEFVQRGMHDPKARMFEKRYNLGEADLRDAMGKKLTLPTETWREYVERRKRCLMLRERLAAGEIREINDLITDNLNIRQFAQDVIENCEGPELLRAMYHAIEKITVLDPTCGSGAFLFAALNILEPLYEACLDRMEVFLEDLARSGVKHRPKKFSDFRKLLDRVASHPNRRYFILKSIIVNNLYGVDIMEEAVEICKLRLFLKLVAQVEKVEQIEPLPDIDFNIRAGNTLVGYANLDEIKKSMEGDWVRLQSLPTIEENAEIADRAFQKFHEMQTAHGMEAKDFADAKRELWKRLKALEDELNRYLAQEYGTDPAKRAQYEKWLASHKPFHWFIEFYRIMKSGGFDVIIGNPPYLELREVDYMPHGFKCGESGAIHAMCIERSTTLLHQRGCMSMIVPLSLPSTQRMKVVQDIIENCGNVWCANYAWRPAKLFDTVNRALTIFVITPSTARHTFSTNYQKWTSDNRDGLFERLLYVEVPRARPTFWIPKLGHTLEQSTLKKCLAVKTTTMHFLGNSEHHVYYRTTGGLYWKVFTDFAPAFRLNGQAGHSSRETSISVTKREDVKSLIAGLSSDVFWWWYTISSNLRDLNPSDVQNFPIPEAAISDVKLRNLGKRYLEDINRNSTMLIREQRQTGRTETQSFKIQKSKPIIDLIDCVLAKHYGFTEEELDFIINYDIKYRMGQDAEADNGE